MDAFSLTSEGSVLPSAFPSWKDGSPALFPLVSLPVAKSTKPGALEPTLPGHGESGPDCGSPVAVFCNDCGSTFTVESSCMMRSCPNCYGKWAASEARRASWRLWLGCHKKYWRYGVKARLVHLVVSVPDRGQSLPEFRQVVRRVLRAHGITGHFAVFHPFRRNESGQYARDGYLHSHVLGVAPGDITPGGTDGAGVMFKHIRDKRSGDFRGLLRMQDCQRLIAYLLSHCGIVEGRHAATWGGEFSYNKLNQGALEAEYPAAVEAMRQRGHRCPVCGSWNTEPCIIYDSCGYWPPMPITMHPPPRVNSEES